jgi:hypothetical protein
MEDYNVKLHRLGRIWTLIALLAMTAVPVLACIILGTGPEWGALAVALGILGAMNIPVALGEVFAYSYILGTNGTYLAFITGNLSNLKIPCVINAANLAGTTVGTEENELASTISIAVSTIVNTLVIGLGVLLVAVTPAASIFEHPALQPAFNVVVYALFGALGGQYIVKHPKIAVLPFLGMTALTVILVVSGMGGTLVKTSYMVFVGVVACFFNAKRLYNKKQRETVVLSGGEEVNAAENCQTQPKVEDAPADTAPSDGGEAEE